MQFICCQLFRHFRLTGWQYSHVGVWSRAGNHSTSHVWVLPKSDEGTLQPAWEQGTIAAVVDSTRFMTFTQVSHMCVNSMRHLFLFTHTAVKRGARAPFSPKLSLNKVLIFRKFSLSSPKLRQSLKS